MCSLVAFLVGFAAFLRCVLLTQKRGDGTDTEE